MRLWQDAYWRASANKRNAFLTYLDRIKFEKANVYPFMRYFCSQTISTNSSREANRLYSREIWRTDGGVIPDWNPVAI